MFLRTKLSGRVILAMLSLMAGRSLAASTNDVPTKVFYVDNRFQGNSPTGESWLSAFPALQDAIDAAAKNGGGEVWVKRGIHTPNGTKRSTSFKLKTGVHLYGGFRGEETERKQRNPKANPTTLSGDLGQIGNTKDNCYHVLTVPSETSVNGFTIAQGLADGEDEESFGGGIHLLRGSRQVIFSDCTFEKNRAKQEGGAAFIPASEVSFTNCTFYSNGADKNGGALATTSDTALQISACIFSANRAERDGGAVFLKENASAWIQDSFFLYNVAQENGGALAVQTKTQSSRPIKLNRCTFRENSAQKNGGAVYFSGPFFPVIFQCSFNFNISGLVGAVGIENNCVMLAQECTFGRNKGNNGADNMGADKTSSIIKSEEEFLTVRPAEEPQEIKPAATRSLPDAFVLNPQDRSLIKLRKLIAARKYTLLILGDVTNPDFIKNYRIIEALALNHQSKDLQTYYIQRRPTYPENHGYLAPFNENEITQLAKESAHLLKTKIPWICDTLENDVILQLPPNRATDVFIYSAEGAELFAGSLLKPAEIQRNLTQLLGPPGRNIRPSQLPAPDIDPVGIAPAKRVERIHFNPNNQIYIPLQQIPRESRHPFYVKLRAEADQSLLTTGQGKLYLGFHIDPLYKSEWDNKTKPLKYTLIPTAGTDTISPITQSAPEIRGDSDTEPREFLINATRQSAELPILLKVDYSVYLPALKGTVQVSQEYVIHLRQDPLGGKAYRRQIAYQDPIPDFQVNQSTTMPNALRQNDTNNDNKISRNEVKGTLWSKFIDIDTNRDGYLNNSEYNAYLINR